MQSAVNMPSEDTSKNKPHRFRKGESGNPAGRPLGSKNKLSELFWKDFHDDWATHGKQALIECAVKHPKDFVKVGASLQPKGVELEADITQHLELSFFVHDYKLVLEAARRIGAEPILLEAIDEDD